MTPFKRTFRVGKAPAWSRRGTEVLAALWITVEYKIEHDKGRLSITGVHGPQSDGDCLGSCGQCTDTLKAIVDGPAINLTEGMTRERLARLLDVWQTWHLNDMHADCEHMKRDHGWNPLEPLTIWKWKLKAQTCAQQKALRDEAERRMMAGETAHYEPKERELLALKYWVRTSTDTPPSDDYEADGSETKTAGWVYPPETGEETAHPRGLLGKACPTCGHKYGSAWLYRPVPEDVLQFLAEFPDDAAQCPWKR